MSYNARVLPKFLSSGQSEGKQNFEVQSASSFQVVRKNNNVHGFCSVTSGQSIRT